MHVCMVFQFGKAPTQIYLKNAVLQQIKAQRNEGTKENKIKSMKKMFNHKKIKAHIKTLKQETFYL